MIIGIVIGNVWATKKEDVLCGHKLMVVQRIDPRTDERLESFVAVDCVGAGITEQVLVVTGSSARKAVSSPDLPIDAAIVGILDQVEITKGI